MKRLLLFVIVLTVVSGCAVGHRLNYEGRSNFKFKSDDAVVVAVHDMRPYVQSGNKKPNFAGILKSIYGIPYSVTTTSGNPLSDDFGGMIAETMDYRGVSALQEKVSHLLSPDTIKEGSSPD